MEAMTMMSAKARLAYYDAMRLTAPERVEMVSFREVLRRLLRMRHEAESSNSIILAPAGRLNG